VQAESDRLAPSHSALRPDSPASALPPTTLLSMDGGMVNIRDEGWKEFKVGGVGQVVGDEPLSSPWVAEVHTQPVRYAASLGEVSVFAPVLLELAAQTGFQAAVRSCIVADGAAWIWNLADTHFPASVQIVDWYHAYQHLHQAAETLFPQQSALSTAWLAKHTTTLFQGDADTLVTAFHQAGQPQLAHFFVTHRNRLHYSHFEDQGYPLGSGTIESAVKQFKTRLTGPGMRWSRTGVQRILRVRTAVLDGSFDARWSQAA
jgi:hypothetical protein